MMSGEYTMGHLKADIERFVESRDDTHSDERFDTEKDQAKDVLGKFVEWLDSSESDKLRKELAEARSRIDSLNQRANLAEVQRDEFKRKLAKFEQL
jgi:uncharacterized protein YfcZ (UPF0381/DUF406 family)